MVRGLPVRTGARIGVLIPDAGSVHTLPVARCLAAEDKVDVWLLLDQHPSPEWRTRHKAGVLRMGDGLWPAEVLEAAEKTAASVLLPISETGIRQLAIHEAAFAGKINFVEAPNSRTLDVVEDKAELAEFAAQTGIPVPKSWVFDPASEKTIQVSEMRFPVLAKPAASTAGHGIQMLGSPGTWSDSSPRRRCRNAM